MLECIEVVAAYIHILAVLVLGQRVVLLIRADDGGCVHIGEHTGIVFAKKSESRCFVGDIRVFWQRSLKCLNVEFSVACKALREIPLKHTYLFATGLC